MTVTVYSNGTTRTEFTSYYGRFVKVTAKHIQQRGVSWNIQTDVYEKQFAVGTIIEIAYSTNNLDSELYINGRRVTTFRGAGRHTYSYTLQREEDLLIEALDPWFPFPAPRISCPGRWPVSATSGTPRPQVSHPAEGDCVPPEYRKDTIRIRTGRKPSS